MEAVSNFRRRIARRIGRWIAPHERDETEVVRQNPDGSVAAQHSFPVRPKTPNASHAWPRSNAPLRPKGDPMVDPRREIRPFGPPAKRRA